MSVWSPDGTRIALSQSTEGGAAEEWIAIQPVPGGPRLDSGRLPMVRDISRIVWAPDATDLLVWVPDGHLRHLDPATGRQTPLMIGVDSVPSWQRLAP